MVVKEIIQRNNPVKLELIGEDGNAFAIMGRFRREAKKQGWSNEDIDLVLEECMSGDYNHLLNTIQSATYQRM